MIELPMRDFITSIDKRMADIFHEKGVVHATWFAVGADDQGYLIPVPLGLDKDSNVAHARAFFRLHNVVRYVFVAEAWQATVSDRATLDKAIRDGLEHHPGRDELLMYSGEDALGLTNACRKIERPKHGKPRLGPLEFQSWPISEGRMVGLLPQRGTVQ